MSDFMTVTDFWNCYASNMFQMSWYNNNKSMGKLKSAPKNLIEHSKGKSCSLMSGDSIMIGFERTSSKDSVPCKDGETPLLPLNTIVEPVLLHRLSNTLDDCWR